MKEYFDVVDEDDRVIGRATREQCHSNPELIHRSVQILVFNDKGQLLLQKRSMLKDLYKGMWEISASGHMGSGDVYENAAAKELLEELGIRLPLKRLFSIKYRSPVESENMVIFSGQHNGPFKFNKEEIEIVRFFSLEEIKKLVKEHPERFVPSVIMVVREYQKRFKELV